ncbi:MAG: DUF4230 domain-containing protein [Sandaracinaceae bacterium]
MSADEPTTREDEPRCSEGSDSASEASSERDEGTGPAASAFSEAFQDKVPPPVAPVAAPSRTWLRVASFGLLTLIGSCLGGIAVRGAIDAFTPEEPPPVEVIEVQPTPDVITAMRDLSRLETASFHVERVVDLRSRQRRLFGLVEANDSILLVAAADVVAGVDLTRMEDGDVVIENDRAVRVTLPPVEIFSARLDNDRTYVYERDTDALAQRRENLETRARREAERTLRQSALEGGIEERAQNNARATIEALIRSLGFDEVEVEFRGGEL